MQRPLSRIIMCAALVASAAVSAVAQGDPRPSAAVAVEQNAAAWKKLAPAGSGFTALMPGTASEQTAPVKSARGDLQNHLFTLETPLAAYIVSYVEFPEPVTDPETIKRMLDGGRDSGLSSASATLRSEREIKIDGHPGREWVMGVQGKFVAHARAYWVKQRLYQALIIMEDAPANASAATLKLREDTVAKFLNSFALADEAAATR
ncbi:MAG TPA: hypothetical protein VFX96_18600 [Pyrinomonadaceae bacterium]|nr:hypothetical protein [Pyrinomonadaceae bacterium]